MAKFTKADLELIEKTKLELSKCNDHGDAEVGHERADDLLIELIEGLGVNGIKEEYGKVKKFFA